MKCIFLTVVVQLIAQAFAHENCLSSAIIGDSRRLFRRDGLEFGYTGIIIIILLIESENN